MRHRFTRRALLVSGAAPLVLGMAGCSEPSESSPTRTETTQTTTQSGVDSEGTEPPAGDSDPTSTTAADRPQVPASVAVDTVAEGFTAPIAIAFPEPATAFVADQRGVIDVIEADGRRERPLLDVRDRLVSLSGYEERGLLGIAVHPAYPEDPRLFVRYSAPPRAGTPDSFSHTFVLSSFTLDPDGLIADPASEQSLLEIPQPQANHNAGSLTFGPEGFLYVGVGDGGGANDTGLGHVADWYDANGGGNGQDVTENLLGSILRLDVTQTGSEPYAVPKDNPLVGREGRDEHYAWGFRNPWGLSVHDGELYAADVGQNRFEEINHVRAGGNFGWNVREGRHCFSTASPGSPPDSCPDGTPDGNRLIDPVIEYPHDGDPLGGAAVVGGHFYSGESIPGLRNRYVFADWRASNQLFVGTPTNAGPWETDVVSVVGETFGSFVLAFGRDPRGELYVGTTREAGVSGSTGAVHRLVPA